MTKKCNPNSKAGPSVAPLVRDDKHKRLVRDDNEGFVILSECEGSLGWVSPESKPRSFGHDTGLRMTNKGKPEIPRSLRSLGMTNINGLFGTTGWCHPEAGEHKKAEGLRPWPGTLRFSMVCFYGLFLWSVSILNT